MLVPLCLRGSFDCFIFIQVAASTNKEVDAQIPNYPNLPPQLICQLHNVTMHVSSNLDHHVVFYEELELISLC